MSPLDHFLTIALGVFRSSKRAPNSSPQGQRVSIALALLRLHVPGNLASDVIETAVGTSSS